MHRRTAVIVGGSSMLARRLPPPLNARGFGVMRAGRSAENDIRLDLADNGALDIGDARADVVIHCAAAFEADTIEGMQRNARVNAEGAFRIGALAHALGAKQIIYVSSLSVIERPENAYFGSYGLSKRQGGENLRLFCARHEMSLATLMPSQIIDIEGESRLRQPLFWAMLDTAAAGKDIVLYGKADPPRDLVFIGDVADALCVLAERGANADVVCTGPDKLSIEEIAKLIQAVFNRGGGVVRDTSRADMKSIWAPDSREDWKSLGLSPRPLEAIVRDIAARM